MGTKEIDLVATSFNCNKAQILVSLLLGTLKGLVPFISKVLMVWKSMFFLYITMFITLDLFVHERRLLIIGFSTETYYQLWHTTIAKKGTVLYVGEKGRDLTQSCDKTPTPTEQSNKATWQHKNSTKNFDYTTIADRLRTVSWSDSSHPTGVVKPVNERSTFPLTATAV